MVNHDFPPGHVIRSLLACYIYYIFSHIILGRIICNFYRVETLHIKAHYLVILHKVISYQVPCEAPCPQVHCIRSCFEVLVLPAHKYHGVCFCFDFLMQISAHKFHGVHSCLYVTYYRLIFRCVSLQETKA